MKKNILNNTIMKTMKYICLLLMIIGTSAHALATEETLAFNNSTCVWGMNQGGQSYSSGTFGAYGFTIYGDHIKYNYYKEDSYPYTEHWQGVQLQYLSSGNHDAAGYIILPNFGGKVTAISIYTFSGAGSKTQSVTLYVGGVSQGEKNLTGTTYTTPATWSSLNAAAGTEVKIVNTSSNQELHIERIVVTHEGAAIGTPSTPSDGKPQVSTNVSPAGAGTITLSNSRPNTSATITITATPNSGFTFSYWEAKSKYGCSTNYYTDSNIGSTSSASTTFTVGDDDNYTHMLTAVFVESTCTKTPTITFATSGTIEKKVGADVFTNAATVKFNGSATGQTITYSSSNESIAYVDDATGDVLVADNAVGSATITASVVESGDYCAQSASYTVNVTGYSVTYHVESCATGKPTNKTNYFGSLTLPTGLAVDGYQFAGWTTNSSYGDSSTPPTLQPASITVSADIDLYAVFKKVSSTFEKMPENTSGSVNTSVPEGDYVICTNYEVGSTARVMTNNLDNNKRMTTDASEYTFTSAGLSCTDEEYIWHISGTAGNYLIYNAATSKYLAATSGSTANNDRKVRLVDASSDNYAKWTIEQNSGKVPYLFTNTKRKNDSETEKSFGVSSNNIFFRGDSYKASFYLFKRVSAGSVYTIHPDCDAAEYTVTFNLSSAPTGATVTASATGATFSSPVLAPVTSGTAVTINATAPTGYTFGSWTVTSGGATLDAAATTANNSFDMPSSNVVLTPSFNPIDYTITYKDKGDVAFSGTPSPTPTTHTYGTSTALPTSFTKTVGGVEYVFMGWYDDSNCTDGHQISTVSATTQDITVYALWVRFNDPLAWCPEPEMSITGTTYITAMYHAENGGMIRGSAQITVSGRNLTASQSVTLTSNNSAVYFSLLNTDNIKRGTDYQPKTSITLTTDVNGKINGDEGQAVYVHFMPATLGDGSISDVTITATYALPDPDLVRTGHVYVRSMPAQFAIATKVGDTWYALPANIHDLNGGEKTNPAPVQISVDETNWTAKGPSTVGYALWPVKTTNAGASYTNNGDHWRIVGNENRAVRAYTTSTSYDLNAVSTVTAVGDDVTTSYEWQITTNPTNALDPTDGTWMYYIQSHQTNNTRYLNIKSTDIVWGTYNAGYELTKDMYLLPLTVVEPANMSVMEWGESEVAVKCAANTTLTSVKIDGTEVSPKPSLTKICGDIYKITGGGMPNLSTLATYAMKQMVIDVEESSTAKQCILTIPFILTSSNSDPTAEPSTVKTAVDLRNLAAGSSQDARNDVIKSADVVVRNNAQLDVTNDESTYCTFRDLYVYPGGKVHINTLDLGANNVYLRGGFSWLEGSSKDYRLPQMWVENGKKIQGIGTSGHGVYYDLYLDNNMYYMMALPKDVALAAVTNEEGGDDWNAWVKGYSGEGRTKDPKETGWKYAWEISPGTHLYRGAGYEIAIKPRSSGVMAGRTIGILRFPLLTGTAWTDEATPEIYVTAWGKDDTKVSANNKGWNYIGNPFFTSFQNTDENGRFGTNMEIRQLTEEIKDGKWTGKYVWVTDTEVKYVTVPRKMETEYDDVRSKNYKLESFFPFFIQAAGNGNLSFSNGSRILKAPSLLRTTVPAREVDIDFLLTDPNGGSDNAGLTVGNDYSAEFDMDDKEKTIVNENNLKVYTMVGEYRTAFNSLPESAAALPIPVGYIAPVDGKYIFSLDEAEYAEVEHVYLTDYDKNVTVDLLDAQDNAYEFEATKGTNNTRLALNIILKPEDIDPIETGVDAIETDNDVPTKFIYQDKMYILYHGIIYDATGKKVSEIK